MPFGITSRLLLLVGLSVIPFLAFTLYLADQRREDELRHTQQHVSNTAQLLALSQARMIDHARQLIGALSSDKAAFTPERCKLYLAQFLDLAPANLRAGVTDLQGRPLCSASQVPPGFSIADREYFVRAIRGDTAQSGLLFNRITGRPSVMVAYPIRDAAERITAVLVAPIDMSFPADVLRHARLPQGAAVTLVDSDGTIFARAPHDAAYIGKKVSRATDFARVAARQTSGFVEAFDRGEERIVAYARVGSGSADPIFVRVGFPKSAADAISEATLQQGLLALAAILLIGGAAAGTGALLLVARPIRRLTQLAERLRKGELSARSGLPRGRDEIGRLALAFDELASNVQRSTRALRTLSAANQALLREREEKQLLRAMCEAAVEKGGYLLGAVNYPRADGSKNIDVIAVHGDEAFAQSAVMTWDDSPTGEGTVGECMKSGRRVIARSFDDPRLAAWRAQALPRGFRSVISLPLRVRGELIGTFTLIAGEEDAFDDAEVAVLDEMAADLSFGIEMIRAEALRKQAEAIAVRALTHDALVDLPNRTSFIRMVVEAMSKARDSNSGVAVLAVHVGRLQEIFDSFGFDPYRAVLKEIAGRLASLPVCKDALARLPMEDFGVLVPSRDENLLGVIADRLLGLFREPIAIGEVKLDVRAAVGVSFFPDHGDNAESLVRRASIVGREAFGKDVVFRVYQGVSERENPGRLALASDLRAAIEGGKLELHYQPKVRIADAARVGYEALARWFHPVKGAIPPVTFVPLAEQMGLIGPMTNQIVRMALRQQSRWAADGKRLPVAVNLSARNLYDPLLLTSVDRWLKAYDVPGELLQLEITESALVEDPAAARKTLNELRARGSTIYIDDFGTGYSSLSYLATLPVNSLKIDRSFIRQMASSREAYSVVASIISMARSLNMGVVAEGVETEEDLAALRQLGCDEAQGWLFGRPVPAEQI